MKLNGAQIICESLIAEGVSIVFGHPGGAVLPLYNALYEYPELRHVLVRHEQGGSHAAEGYARATGAVGVCMATSGPGATNMVTGLQAAKMDSVPMVAITGQVVRSMLGKEGFQEADTLSITKSATKKNYLVMEAKDLAQTIFDAFREAQSGRPGPVLIDVPRDVQQELTEFSYPPRVRPQDPAVRSKEDPNILEAARLVNSAERPVIIVGHGVHISQAWDQLQTLAELADIPVANTLHGVGAFPRSHSLSLGMMGMHGIYSTNLAVDQADLILGVGLRFDDRVVGREGSFSPHAKVIHIEVDPGQIEKMVKTEVALVGDARTKLMELTTHVNPGEHTGWRQSIQRLTEDHPCIVPPGSKLTCQYVLQELSLLLGEQEDFVVVTGVGQHQMWAAQFLEVDKPNSFLSSGGLGVMGYEIPAAMGAQLGRPEAAVWSIAGDGGFQMTVQELATIASEKLPVKIALINNGELGMVRQWQELFYDEHYKAVKLQGPDYVKLSEAYGIPALRIDSNDDVRSVLKQAQNHDGPFLLEFVVNSQENVYPMVAPGKSLGETIEDPRLSI